MTIALCLPKQGNQKIFGALLYTLSAAIIAQFRGLIIIIFLLFLHLKCTNTLQERSNEGAGQDSMLRILHNFHYQGLEKLYFLFISYQTFKNSNVFLGEQVRTNKILFLRSEYEDGTLG